mgnify:FL=1
MPNPIRPGAGNRANPANTGSDTNNNTDTSNTGDAPRSNITSDIVDGNNVYRRAALGVLGAAATIPSMVGVAHATEPAPNVDNVDAPPVDLDSAQNETFDLAKMKDYAFYKAF